MAGSKIQHVLFVRFPKGESTRFHPYEAVWPLSAAVAATILKRRGMKVEVLDPQARSDVLLTELVMSLKGTRADLVFVQYDALSCHITVAALRQLKAARPSIQIVGFGHYAAVLPQEIMAQGLVDICITCDPEFVVTSLVDALVAGDLDQAVGIMYRDADGVMKNSRRSFCWEDVDIDALPPVDLSLLDLNVYRRKKFPKPFFWGRHWGFIRTSFGCPHPCVFCSPLLRHSISKQYQRHSVRFVVDQIRYYQQTFGINVFSIEDDVFGVDPDWVADLCRSLKPLKIHWVVDGFRADCAHGALLRDMRQAGCYGVSMGIESGSDRILQLLRKGQTQDQIGSAARMLHQLGFLFVAYVIIGNPTETQAELEQTMRFVEVISPHVLYVHYFTPYPGSSAYDDHAVGRKVEEPSHYFFSGVNCSQIPTEILSRAMIGFYRRYYFSVRYMQCYLDRFKYAIFDGGEAGLMVEALQFLAGGHKLGWEGRV